MSFPSYKISFSRNIRDRSIRITTVIAAALTVMPLLLVFQYVAVRGWPGLNLAFFLETPVPMGSPGGGMANAVLGSAILVGLASVLATPFGILCGIYLAEYRTDRFTSTLRLVLDLLASTPSIVVGLFAYTLIVVPMKSFSIWAGASALAFMMFPVVARTSEEILKLNTREMREAGLALGLKRWRVILFILLKGSLPAVMSGVLLALARCAGETAPLLFTSFNNQYWSTSFKEPSASLPVQIYNYAISPFPQQHAKAWTGALVLLLCVFTTNIVTRFIMISHRKGNKR
jgi:phosphate transport system permease protein